MEIVFTKNSGIQVAINEFNKLLKMLDSILKFSYDDDLGYLTSMPYKLGEILIEV